MISIWAVPYGSRYPLQLPPIVGNSAPIATANEYP
jgi:hypothetical protein